MWYRYRFSNLCSAPHEYLVVGLCVVCLSHRAGMRLNVGRDARRSFTPVIYCARAYHHIQRVISTIKTVNAIVTLKLDWKIFVLSRNSNNVIRKRLHLSFLHNLLRPWIPFPALIFLVNENYWLFNTKKQEQLITIRLIILCFLCRQADGSCRQLSNRWR